MVTNRLVSSARIHTHTNPPPPLPPPEIEPPCIKQITITDLDSLTSALLYAYLRSSNPPPQAFTPLYIPLLNIPAADVRIRPEFAALFRHAHISPAQLVTLDDLPPLDGIEHVLRPGNTRWILVDHNNLQGRLGVVYAGRVRGVVDHHGEENAVPTDTGPEPRVVETCGSCTSLVVRTLRGTWDAISSAAVPDARDDSRVDDDDDDDGMVRKSWDAQIAKLALASIQIDTADLAAEDKVEAADREAVRYLCGKIQSYAPTWDRTRFYTEIHDAKTNLDGLQLDEILRRDYKEWTEENGTKLGISSVVKPLEFLVAKAHQHGSSFDQAINTFIHDKAPHIFAIMTAYTTSSPSSFHRQLLLQSTTTALLSTFSKTAHDDLQLQDLAVPGIWSGDGDGSPDSMMRKVWTQGNLARSRKQVAPLLRTTIS